MPAELEDKNNPNWVPSLKMGHEIKKKSAQDLERARRAEKRRCIETRKELDCDSFMDIGGENSENSKASEENSKIIQTDHKMEDIKKMEEDLLKKNKIIEDLENQIKKLTLQEIYFQNDSVKLLYHTGLPSMEYFEIVLNMIREDINKGKSAISPFQKLLITLMKLRLNMTFTGLAYRFNISRSQVARIFYKVLKALDKRLKCLIHWPDRNALRKTMPSSFKAAFGEKVAVIIDCFEIFIEKPSSLDARAETWSNYKHRNTIKYLIGITPQGTISFISDGWGGRTSDKQLTLESGILENLLPGDFCLADRGFNIADDVAYHFATVVTPAFTKGKNQLHPMDIEKTRKIASVRIHVERVIGELRLKFNILNGPVPTEMLINKNNVCSLDLIVRVCSALINLCPTIVNN